MTKKSSQHKRASGISYRRLLLFFLPLAATPILIGSTHSITNGVLARLAYPELSIAVFSVVQAFFNTIKAPGHLSKDIVVALVDDKQSLGVVVRFVTIVCLAFLVILIPMAYTPLGEWFLRHVMGLEDDQAIAFAYSAMRIACFLPISEVFRNTFQGLAIGVRHTGLLTLGTAFRVVVISLVSWWAVSSQMLSGMVVGAFIWTVGLGLEGLFLAVCFLRKFKTPTRAVRQIPKRGQGPLSMGATFRFFWPLAVMMFVGTSLQPIVQGIIARSAVDPTLALAAYGVAIALFGIISGPLMMLHQCSLVFVERTSDGQWPLVHRFCTLVGVVVALLLVITATTPVGFWLLHRVIGVSSPIAAAAQPVLLSFSLFPVLRAWQEFYWGVLLRLRVTSVIGVGKVINLGCAAVLLLLLVSLPWEWLAPAVAGGLAVTGGQGMESLYLWYCTKQQAMTNQRGVGVA